MNNVATWVQAYSAQGGSTAQGGRADGACSGGLTAPDRAEGGDCPPIDPSAPYHVVDGQTGAIVRTYTYARRRAARRYADKLDLAYGAYRYRCKLGQA